MGIFFNLVNIKKGSYMAEIVCCYPFFVLFYLTAYLGSSFFIRI